MKHKQLQGTLDSVRAKSSMAHKKTNKSPSKLLIALVVAIAIGATFAQSVFAATSQLQVQVGDPPPDLCPNIGGIQASIPAGMQLDINGNCYTPTPPPPPPPPVDPPVDLCNNISGTQSVLPAGYYRTTGGDCFEQPVVVEEQTDVCPNIDGQQTAVPSEYQLDISNNCIPIPTPVLNDECPNIGGPQETMPEGMTLDENGACYTPDIPLVTTPVGPKTPTTPVIKNLPTWLAPAVLPVVNIIPEETKVWLRSIPEETAKTMPYYIFAVIGTLALIPVLQAVREAIYVRQLLGILKRERDIAEQKDNFISLASHYLRTPLTLMKSGLDTIVALNELPATTLQPLGLVLGSLNSRIDGILQDIEKNAGLKNIASPPEAKLKERSVFRSAFFWAPIVTSIVLVLASNFLLGVVGEKELGTTNMFLQFVTGVIIAIILYLSIRNFYLQRKLHAQNEALIKHEKTIDEARNAFINETTIALRDGLDKIDGARSVIADAPSARFFNEGYERFYAILEKFLLLSQVQTGVERTLKEFDLRQTVDQLLIRYQSQIAEKQLTVTNNTSSLPIVQNPVLFNFVLSSLLDNAIKFNQPGGKIVISANEDSKSLSLQVGDNGIGIDQEKLGQLFKPFSRATSSVQFNYEGLGFSLFLDKIIMDYTGGTIAASSTPNRGTSITLSTPLVDAA